MFNLLGTTKLFLIVGTFISLLMRSSEAATLNLVKNTISSASYSPSNGANWKKYDNTWQKSAQNTGFLSDGDQNADENYCICGRMQTNNQNAETITYMTLTLTSDVQVKTIITTMLAPHSAAMAIDFKSTTVASWTPICTSTVCTFGSNDLSGVNDGSYFTLNQLQFTFTMGGKIMICEVLAYSFKNYAPSAIKFDFYYKPNVGNTKYLDRDSYDLGQSSMSFMSSGQMLGTPKNGQNFYRSIPHTCNYVDNEQSSQNTNGYIVVTLKYYMEIKEIYNFGDFQTDFYLGDPLNAAFSSTSTASTLNTLLSTSYTSDASTFTIGMKKITVGATTGVFSTQCSVAECTTFATNKIIVTSPKYKDFYTCGFAIMATIVTCASSNLNLVTQCNNHSKLGAFTTTPTAIKVDSGMTSTPAQTLSCPDPLSLQCFASPLGLTNGCAKIYSMQCTDCSNCATSATCSGTCTSYAPVSFATTSKSTSSDQFSFTVTPTVVQTSSCQLVCTMGLQVVYSNPFKLSVCGSCATTVLSITTAFTPASPGIVAIGQTGALLTFTAPTNSYTDCTGNACADTFRYEVICRNQSISATPAVQKSFSQVQKSQTSIQVYATSLINQNTVWVCQIQTSIPGQVVTSGTFTIQFDMCINAAESCPYDIQWPAVTSNAQWIPPVNLIVYTTGVAVSTTLDYSKWKDKFYTSCLTQFCGKPLFTFVDNLSTATNIVPLAFQPAVTISDNLAGTVTFTVQTLGTSYVGSYSVKILATLDTNVAWTGARPSSSWSFFTVDIISPCLPTPLCKSTTVEAQLVGQVDMNILVNGQQSTQNFPTFTDYISRYCQITCSQTARSYSLINVATGAAMPFDLAGIQTYDSQTMSVYAGTSDFTYSGVYTVYILATVNLQYYGGFGSNSAQGNQFLITIDPCKSCSKTVFATIGTQPSSFSIGVENTPGSTLFSQFANKAAFYCQNATKCNMPTYELECVTGCTAGAAPPFTSGITLDGSGNMKVSAQTTDLTLAGVYTVRVKVTLDLTTFGTTTPLTGYTNNFNITINACSPLPCLYNQIIAPITTGTFASVNHLPSTQVVLCDNTVTSDYFSGFTDTVSTRCSGATYSDMCGPKQYTIEAVGTGAALPISVTVGSGTGTSKTISESTGSCGLVSVYDAQIHARFVTPTTTPSDNTQVTFKISVEYPDSCNPLICASSVFSAFDATLDIFPSDFSVSLNNTWQQTNFSNFRDTKSDKCDGKSGGFLNGTLVPLFSAPVCGYPTYEVYLVSTNSPLSTIFGGSNVQISQLGPLQWALQVRTSLNTLDGTHLIFIKATINGVSTQSPIFILTVIDPCNPYNCSETAFYPIPTGIAPQSIIVSVGQGYVPSNQGLWTDKTSSKCSNAILGSLCGTAEYTLLQANGSTVPFHYFVKTNELYTQVMISVEDPSLAGLVYSVYLVGYTLDSNNQPFGSGASNVFTVTIIASTSIDYGKVTQALSPIFSTFPSDQTLFTNSSQVQLDALATEQNGTIASVSAQLGAAIDFMSLETTGTNQVTFFIAPTNKSSPGDYKINVFATDGNGVIVMQSFKVTILKPPAEAQMKVPTLKDNLPQNIVDNSTQITATVKSLNTAGVLEIWFSEPVIPISDISLVTNDDFFMTFEQNSIEKDQTQSFQWSLVNSTPLKLIVQLIFEAPIDVSQGNQPDQVHIWMDKNIFMIKDKTNLHRVWKQSISLAELVVQKTAKLVDQKYFDISQYCQLSKVAPMQMPDQEAYEFVKVNIEAFSAINQAIFWAPFCTQFVVPQAMEKTWLVFGSLQIVNMMTQLNILVPPNVNAQAGSFQKSANSQLTNNLDLYEWLKQLGSDRKVANEQTQNSNLTSNSSSVRKLTSETLANETQETVSPFQSSKFYEHGSTEMVVQSAAQLLIVGVLIIGLAIFGLFFWKSFLWFLPVKVSEVFHKIRLRMFYSFPLRLLSQQYLQVTFAALLNLHFNMNHQSLEQKTNLSISIAVIVLYSLAFPIWIIFFIRRNYIRLQTQPLFRGQWNTLCLRIDLQKYYALFLLAFTLIRRLLLTFTLIWISRNILQLLGVMILQQILIIFVMQVLPMDDYIGNVTLVFNEAMLSMLTINLFLFTEYVPDPIDRFKLGQIFLLLVYIMVAVTMGVWVFDVYLMLKWQYKLAKVKLEIARRKRRVLQHNKKVDKIGKHNSIETNVGYKRKTIIANEQMSVIESAGNEESIKDSGSNRSEALQKTVVARKLEFTKQMLEMRSRNDFDENVKVNQYLSQGQHAGNLDLMKTEQAATAQNWDEIFKDLLPVQNEQKLMKEVQKETDWPVSPRHPEVIRSKQVQAEDEEWNWDREANGSRASRWNAMPSEQSEPDSVDLNVVHNHVGKLPKLKKAKDSDVWISDDSEDKQSKLKPTQPIEDSAVFKRPKKQAIVSNDPFFELF